MVKDFRFTGGDNGFTLIEILVVMAIVAFLSTMGYLITIDFYRSYVFNAERDTIVSLLQKARADSLSNINEAPHGVYFDGAAGQYVVFQGVSYAARNKTLDDDIAYAPGMTRGGISEVIFQQLTGDSQDDNGNPITAPNNNFTITDGKHSEIISLNSQGQINW